MVKYNEANTLSFHITNVSCWLVKDYDYVLVGTCEDEVKLIHMLAYTLCTRMHTITYYAHKYIHMHILHTYITNAHRVLHCLDEACQNLNIAILYVILLFEIWGLFDKTITLSCTL